LRLQALAVPALIGFAFTGGHDIPHPEDRLRVTAGVSRGSDRD